MDNRILYILDSDYLTPKVFEQIKAEKNCSVLCLNHIIKNQFENQKLETISDEDILQELDYVRIDKITYDISKNWCVDNKFEKELMFKGINLGLTIQNELFQNVLKYVGRIVLIQKTLERIQPTEVYTTHGNKILDSIPLKICENNKIKSKILDGVQIRSQENKFDKVNFSLNILKNNIDLTVTNNQFNFLKRCYECYTNTRFRFMTLFEKEQKFKKSILFLDFNLNWHESLFEKYFAKKIQIYCLNNRRPLLWNSNSLKLAKKFHIKKINLTKNDDEEKEYHRILKKLESDLKKKESDEIFCIENFDLWQDLKIEIYDICKKRFKNTIKIITQVEKFLHSTKIDLVWTLDDWGFNKTLVNLCKTKNIPTCLFLAGGLQVIKPEGRLWPLWFAKQRTADKIFLWGENDLQNSIDCGADSTKLVIGGAPKYDKRFFEDKIDEGYIIILTGGFPSTQYSYFNSISFIEKFQRLFERTLYEVKKFNKKIIVKRHPTQGPQEVLDFNEIISRIIPEAIILKNANTMDLISKASLVITVRSTVLQESIILDKPIIFLPYLKEDVGIPYTKSGAVIEINDKENIEKIIHQCLFDENTKRKLKVGRKEFLKNIISFPGNAAEKHVEISLKMINDN